MSKHTNAAVWAVAISGALLWIYDDRDTSLAVRFLPASALLLVGMLLTDAMMVRRTGVCAMRHRPDIRLDAEAAAFATQLGVQYATLIVILGIGFAVQVAITAF